jgi:MFS family permease
LSGPVFALSYSVFGVMWGMAADKYSRAKIATLTCLAWSAASIATGSINGLGVLALCRFIMGVF